MGHLIGIYITLGALSTVLCQSSSHRNVSAVVGNTAILPCSVDFYGDQQVIWKDQKSMILTINDQLLIDDKRFSVLRPYVREWNLQIKHVRTNDQGTYTCLVNSTPIKNKHVSLTVWYPPSITDSSPPIVGSEVGDDVTLKCNATGFPSPTIRWYKLSMTGERQEIGRNKTSVTFTNITHEDGGTYECEADNGVSPVDKKSIKIDIRSKTITKPPLDNSGDNELNPGKNKGDLDKSSADSDVTTTKWLPPTTMPRFFSPHIRLPYQKISQEMGKETLLECIIEANPLSDQYWEKDGQRLENSDKYKLHVWEEGGFTKVLGIFISGLTRADYGEYRCIALNDLGRVEDTVYLYEWRTGELHVTNTPHDVISRSGTSAQFNCTVEGLSSRETLTWWHHNMHTGTQKLFASNPSASKQLPYYLDSKKYEIKGRYNLIVRDIGISDSGTYTCDISGYENYTATLTVVDSLTCNSNGTVHQGEPVVVSCEVTYSGTSVVDWRHSWQHSHRKLSGVITEDSGSSKSHVAFPATLSDSGVYKCVMSHRSPDFSGNCETRLSVRSEGGPAQPVCREGKPGHDVTMVMAIFGAGAAVLFILFTCILIAVVVNYRRQLKKYREIPTKQHQGNMCMNEVDYSDHGIHLYNPRYVSQSSIGPVQERISEHGDGCPDERPSGSHGSGVLASNN